jgi:4-carboxymuconolactone decarboxylase
LPRLAPLDITTLTGEQKRVADAIVAGPRGGLRGPFEPWLRSPGLAERGQLLGEYCRFESVLPADLRELAILLAGRHWKAQFEFWAHSRIGRDAGLADALIEAIRTGTRPTQMSEAEEIVYEFVTEYFATNRVADATYRRAVAELGEQGVVDLVGVVGYYGLVCMTLNVFEVALPDGVTPPFV